MFKLRFNFDEELSDKQFTKLENDLDKKINKLIDKETEKVDFRTLKYVDDLMSNMHDDFKTKIYNIKQKYPIQFNQWIDEKKDYISSVLSDEKRVKSELANAFSDIDMEMTEDDIRLVHLISLIFHEIYRSMTFLQETLRKEKYFRKSESEKILNVFSGFFLLMFRIIELEKHWPEASDEIKDLIEDLIMWDIDTLSNVTNILSDYKKSNVKYHKIDKELLTVLWGK